MREAEEAAQREIEAAAGKGADPFTRRKCQPTVVTKTTDDSIRQQRRDRVEDIYKLQLPEDKATWKVCQDFFLLKGRDSIIIFEMF